MAGTAGATSQITVDRSSNTGRGQPMNDQSDRPVPPSAEDLANADDDTAEELVVSYVDRYLRAAPLDQFGAFSSLPLGMRYVYSTALLEGEVENGGFNQYFFSTSSDYVLEALHGYRRIGALDHARLIRKAINIYHRERWFHFRVKLRRSLDAFFDSYQYTGLPALDEEFLEISEDTVSLRAAYIRSNLDEFLS
jgi:hypothetical protein